MATKKSRGERSWTDEQRQRQSELMRQMHEKRKLIKHELEDKTSGIPDLTLGKLLEILNQFVKGGAKKGTPIYFPTLVGDPEIKREQTIESGNLKDVITIR